VEVNVVTRDRMSTHRAGANAILTDVRLQAQGFADAVGSPTGSLDSLSLGAQEQAQSDIVAAAVASFFANRSGAVLDLMARVDAVAQDAQRSLALDGKAKTARRPKVAVV
jgi:hypothetical protein